ncbi:MAG: hypothetical protein A3E83_05135 [Gammaproteobacteria bacterium RIFCSPHIGHO2_12_FULL_41_20]|nr:MAG: hypothetical protein A3E83_05135 [Gammaproteobacteria bacterium RIFCSPHIGHO2_12_FULL_41_20]
MKRSLKSFSGVTLLEIMLVLAIAAMIIIMSIRYYQSASASEAANSTMSQIQAITAAADNISMGTTGGYINATSVNIQNVLPGGSASLSTPWGGVVTISGQTATSYTVSIASVPANVCPLIISKLMSSTRYSVTSSCSSAAAALTYTYSSTS